MHIQLFCSRVRDKKPNNHFSTFIGPVEVVVANIFTSFGLNLTWRIYVSVLNVRISFQPFSQSHNFILSIGLYHTDVSGPSGPSVTADST